MAFFGNSMLSRRRRYLYKLLPKSEKFEFESIFYLQGAQEVFQELPHVYVHPWKLREALAQYGKGLKHLKHRTQIESGKVF